MSKQFENTLAMFSRAPESYIGKILGGIAMLFLATGLFMAAADGAIVYIAIFGVTIAAAVTLGYFSFRRTRDIAAANAQKRVGWSTADPEVQRQNLNVEVFELSKLLEVETDQMSDLQSAYIVAEDLALRQIQQEENAPLMRHVSVGGVPFDAVLIKGSTIVCIEVSFLVAPDIRQEKVDAIMRKVASMNTAVERMQLGMKVRLMMALVTQLTTEDESHLRSVLNKRRFSETPVDIDIRMLDFEALQRMYVTE